MEPTSRTKDIHGTRLETEAPIGPPARFFQGVNHQRSRHTFSEMHRGRTHGFVEYSSESTVVNWSISSTPGRS